MISQKKRIYLLLSGLFLLGYSWIIVNIVFGDPTKQIVCPIKLATDLPCPSCGSTRSVLNILKGDLLSAFSTNPFGFLIVSALVVGPIWLVYDYFFKKESLWIFYNNAESVLKQKKVTIPLILLVLINWIWNLSKGL